MRYINIEKENILKVCNGGDESEISFYMLNGSLTFLKRFRSNDESLLNNKFNKLEFITSTGIFNNEVEILGAAIENGKFVGYFMKYDPNYIKPINIGLDLNTKINLLRILREKIEILNSYNIFILDFNNGNFLIDNSANNIKLCDLDNFQIGNMKADLISDVTQDYLNSKNNDMYVDNYCFNLYTLSLISGIIMPYIFDYIHSGKMPKCLDTKENREFIKTLRLYGNKYQKGYLIDNIK